MKLQRYRMTGPWMKAHPEGQWVEHDDADARIVALESQVKALTAERDAQAEAVRVLQSIKADIESTASHARDPNVRTTNRPQAEMAHIYAVVCDGLQRIARAAVEKGGAS